MTISKKAASAGPCYHCGDGHDIQACPRLAGVRRGDGFVADGFAEEDGTDWRLPGAMDVSRIAGIDLDFVNFLLFRFDWVILCSVRLVFDLL